MVWLTYVNHHKRCELEQVKPAVTPEPKGKRSSVGTKLLPTADVAPSAYRWNLTRAGKQAEQGKPDAFPSGRAVARPTDEAAGKGCWKKRKSSRNEVDRRSKFASCRKAVDFQQVSRHEKDGQTTLMWESRWRQTLVLLVRPQAAMHGCSC